MTVALVTIVASIVVAPPPSNAAANPNPARITAASWWLMEELLKLQPGSRNGGIYANKPGYHNTRAANDSTNYSVRDAEDKGGPSDKAAAYDWTFPEAQSLALRSLPVEPGADQDLPADVAAAASNFTNIARYSNRLLASAQDPSDPRLDGWREFFGQADNDTAVEGWDFRYGRSATSDSSHLWHIHLSEDRDKVESFENKVALLSVLRGETVSEWLGGATPGNLVGRSGMAYNGAFHMMLQGSDNTLLHHIYRPEDGWQPVRNAGGTLASKPRLIGYNNAIQIFARGTDNTVKYRSLGLNGWSNEWRTVPGAITGTPALATVNNTLYVLARVDTTIRYRYLNLNGWNSDGTWRALGSPTNVQIVSDPTTAVFDNRMYVMALGSDNRIWVRMLNPANDPAWSDWYVLPGTVAGTPTAAVRGDTLLVFARGPQNDVRYHLYHKGDPAWITDRTIHGTTQGDPSAISTTNNTIHVYTRDTQNNIVYRYLNDNGWNDNTTDPTRWRSLGQPTTTLDSNPITISHGSAIHVAARSTDTNLYIRSIDANGWTPWTRLTGNHAPLP